MDFGNSHIVYIVMATAFIALFLLSMGVVRMADAVSKQMAVRKKVRDSKVLWGDMGGKEDASTDAALLPRFLSALGKLGNKPSKQGAAGPYPPMRLRLLRAGIPSPNAGAIVWGAKALLPVLLVIGFFLLRFAAGVALSSRAFLGGEVLMGLMGFYCPEIWLFVKARARREGIIKGLPDALDLLVVCVEAGLGLDSAIQRVADETRITHPQLSGEFELFNLEMRAGKARQEALRALSLRTNIPSLNSLVTLIIQTNKFGTSVSRALRVFSDSFRKQRFQRAEEIAAKLPVKMIIPMVFCIFPSFLLVMVGPAVIQIYENFILKMGH